MISHGLSRCAAILLLATAPTWVQAQVTQVVTKTGPDGKVTETDTTTTAGPAATQAAVTLGTSVVQGSGIAPATTLSSGAGTEETTLLETVAVREAAARLVAQDAFNGKHGVLLVASAQTPDASAWRSFNNQVDMLHGPMTGDLADLNRLDTALKGYKPPAPVHTKSKIHPFIAILPVLAVALPVAQKILSYFDQSIATGGVALTADDYLEEVAIVDLKGDWQILGQSAGMNSRPVDERLATLRTDIGQVRAALSGAHADLQSGDTKGSAALALSDTAINADIKAVTDYMSAVQTPTAMPAILQSQLFDAALSDPNAGVLYLKMHAAAGGLLTRTTFWSNLGIGMPISNAIDVKLSYVFYVKGEPRRSGVFDVATRNLRADKVLDFVKTYDAGGCASGKAIDPDLVAACPVLIGLR